MRPAKNVTRALVCHAMAAPLYPSALKPCELLLLGGSLAHHPGKENVGTPARSVLIDRPPAQNPRPILARVAHKGRADNVNQIGRELGVGYLGRLGAQGQRTDKAERKRCIRE